MSVHLVPDLLARRGGRVCGAGACDVATPRVVDAVETSDFLSEDGGNAGGVATGAGDEDFGAIGGVFLGFDDAFGAGDAQAQRGFDHDVFAGVQGRDGVGLVILVWHEVEDQVDGWVGQDVVWGGDYWDGGAVLVVMVVAHAAVRLADAAVYLVLV